MDKKDKSSRIKGFYNLPLENKRQELIDLGFINSDDLQSLTPETGLPLEIAENMIENVIGTFSLPVGIALNFQVNDRDVLVPMAVEEPSVVAGASFMAKLAREGGGFKAEITDPVMIGQIQILDVKDLNGARDNILEKKDELLASLEDLDPILKELGGGPKDLDVRIINWSINGICKFIRMQNRAASSWSPYQSPTFFS